MNFAASPEAAQLAVDNQTMPLLADIKAPGGDPLFTDDVAVAAQVTSNDASVPYLDWATPTLLTTIQTQVQDLLANKRSADDVVSKTQADYDKFSKSLAK
jgi:raffinose/stachyose/melibiose transport system substrate-binding protein